MGNASVGKKSIGQQLKETFIKATVRETAAAFCTLAFLLFELYRTFIYPMPSLMLNPVHIISVCLLCLLYCPYKPKGKNAAQDRFMQNANTAVDIACAICTPFMLWYSISQYARLNIRIAYLDPVQLIDKIVCVMLLFFILVGIIRTVGSALTIFIGVFIVYGFTAKWLPGILYYGNLTFTKFVDLMIMGTGAIYGTAASAASGFMYWIMVFGSLFGISGGGQVLIDSGMKIAKNTKNNSGPAKAAVVASGLMGMISGSAAANVAGTGVITIPMMKKVGYEPEEAGAIESVASTGGQIMPPIMGTGAFLMAELTGISYLAICKSAAVPALIYYAAVFLLVDRIARKRAHTTKYTPVEIKAEPVLPRLYLLLPIAVLILFIALGYTLQRAAIFSVFSILIMNVISPRMRFGPVFVLNQLIEATKTASTVTQPIAGCGIIIGIITMSGLATRLSAVIASFTGDMLWVALLITMVGCILLGMALPTVAAYLTAYVLFLPTLTKLGIGVLPANMFIFYYGIFAQITPPVCIASYTAAGIAHGSPWKTGWKAFVFSMVAFLAPFVFVFQPGVLLIGSFGEIAAAVGVLILGTAFMVMGIAGFLVVKMKPWERIFFIVGGILVCIPESVTDIIGYALCAAGMAIQIVRWRAFNRKNKDELAKAEF